MRPSERYDIRDRNVCRLSHEQRGWMYAGGRTNPPARCRIPFTTGRRSYGYMVPHRGKTWFILKRK